MLTLAPPDMLRKAQQGDPKAVLRVIEALEPHLKKGARMARDDDAYSDLVVWLLKALRKYRGPPRLPGAEPQLREQPILLTPI